MSNTDQIREDIERTRAELGQDVDALADKVNPGKAAQRQGRKVRRALTSVKDRVMGVAGDVGDSAHDALGNAGLTGVRQRRGEGGPSRPHRTPDDAVARLVQAAQRPLQPSNLR